MAFDKKISLQDLSTSEQDKLRMMRWKCRTDLGYLCREVLGYPDVSDEIHGPVLKILQQFSVPTREQFQEHDKIGHYGWEYKPLQRMTSLPGGRRVLILDPRGWLKTTINAQAHSIQWVLNYPDIAIMIIQSNLDKAEMILGEIKKHFQYNPTFRMLFPEHCPMKTIDDYGTKGKFTTKARARSITRREETFMTSSIDAGTAGIHVDVMKFSDIVEPSNTGTVDQMDSVTRSFYMAENLLVGPNYWIDVEGTRYNFGDCYGHIIQTDHDTPAEKRYWKIHARGCYMRDKKGGPELFRPEELESLPFLKNAKGEFIPYWQDEERGFCYEAFERKRQANPYIFASQQLNSPRGGEDGREIFPVDKDFPAKIKRVDFKQNVRVAYYEAIIDTAETKSERANYSCITIVAFSNAGKVYVNEIIHGKFLPNELTQHIIDLVSLRRTPFTYGSKLRTIKIEETAFTRGLNVALQQHMQLKGVFLPLEYIKRDNQTTKIERIQNSLQPYYMAKTLIFLDDIGCWDFLIRELKQFPKGQSDDILDTLADVFQNKEWLGREVPRYTPEQAHSRAVERWLGIDDPHDPDSYLDAEVSQLDPFYKRTGGL